MVSASASLFAERRNAILGATRIIHANEVSSTLPNAARDARGGVAQREKKLERVLIEHLDRRVQQRHRQQLRCKRNPDLSACLSWMWSSVKQLRDFRWRTLASGEYLMASTSSVIVRVRAHSSVIRCCVADHSGSSFNSTSQNFTSWSALPVAICREPEPPRSAGRASMAHTAPACASIASSIEEEPRSYSSSCPDFVPITTCDHFQGSVRTCHGKVGLRGQWNACRIQILWVICMKVVKIVVVTILWYAKNI